MTVAEFNQRVAVGAQVAILDDYRITFARTMTDATPLLGFFLAKEIDGRWTNATVGMVAPLWFGEECDD